MSNVMDYLLVCVLLQLCTVYRQTLGMKWQRNCHCLNHRCKLAKNNGGGGGGVGWINHAY